MKVIASIAALSAGTAYAGICSDFCVDSNPNCADEDQGLANYDVAGFEDVAECEAHLCSQTFPNDAAAWHECEEGSRLLEERKYNHIVKMAKSQMKTKHSLRTIFKMLQNYGCHCFPGQTRAAGGHGAAVDDQDSLCRDLARCHRCVEMEHGDIIDVNDDKYRFHVKDGAISCERNTEKGWHQSKRDLCECDAHFANEIGKLWDDNNFNDYYWLNPKDMKLINKGKWEGGAKFDIDSTCTANMSGKADQCCGSYPLKYPYDSTQNNCCNNNSIYNPVVSDCCDDGSSAKPGEC